MMSNADEVVDNKKIILTSSLDMMSIDTMTKILDKKREEILKEEGDDPVCTDPKGTDRAAVHATIINEIAGELGL